MNFRTALLLLFVLLLACKEEVSGAKALLDFVPGNASVVIKINDLGALKSALKGNSFLSDLDKIPSFKKALDKICFLDLLDIKSKSILAFVETEPGSFESLYLANALPDSIKLDSIATLSVETFDYNGISMDKYQLAESTFYNATLGDVLVMASSPKIIKNLRVELNSKSTPAALQKLYEISSAHKPATLFLDVKRSKALVLALLKEDSKLDLANFSDWMSLDIDPKPSRLQINGISVTNDTGSNYIDLFLNTKPLTNSTPSIIPLESDAFISYTFDKSEVFTNNQKAFLKDSVSDIRPFETVEEVGIVYMNNQKSVILQTHGAEDLTAHLNSLTKNTPDYQGNQMLQLQKGKLLNKAFHPLVQNFNANFYTILSDAFVFSETRRNLERIITSYKNGTTYDKSDVYKNVKKSLAEESNILFVATTTNLKEILAADFSSDFVKELGENIKTEYGIAAQITADKNFYHTNIIIEKNEKTANKKGLNTLFHFELDTTAAIKPQFVTNHITKKKEVVVQDHKNLLYLISSDGKLLWKKQLGGQIQGDIQQVDIFKNGRLQLAFTTNDQFLVLDRNGKEVNRFTKSFAGGNLNPLAVFDYEGKKNYRFVITQGKKTFMYNSKAQIVTGFKYTSAEDAIISAPKHIRVGKKDHLVFKLKNGSLKIVNRVGDVRVKVSEKIDFSENDVFLNKNKFTLTDKKGTLYQIDQTGKVAKTNFNLSNDHGMFATNKTLVLMNDNILTIRGKKVALELGIYTAPRIFYIRDKIYVAVTDLQSQKAYLFDSQAKPISNFPIFGNSIIDLVATYGDNTLELAVLGKKGELITYKLD